MTELEMRNAVRRAVGGVLFNALNFPERVQSGILGENMGPLNEKVTDAVINALSEPYEGWAWPGVIRNWPIEGDE